MWETPPVNRVSAGLDRGSVTNSCRFYAPCREVVKTEESQPDTRSHTRSHNLDKPPATGVEAERFRCLHPVLSATTLAPTASYAWMGVLVRRPGASPVKYSLVKGNREGEQALAAAAGAGRTLVGILGRQGLVAAKTLLFFEESEHARVLPTGSLAKEYRIVATARTSCSWMSRYSNRSDAPGRRRRTNTFVSSVSSTTSFCSSVTLGCQ